MKYLKFGALILTAVVFLTACGKEEPPVKPADEVVQEALIKAGDYKSGSFEVEMSGEMQVPLVQTLDQPADGSEQAPAMASGSFDFEMEGSYDAMQRDNAKMSMDLDFSAESGDKSLSAMAGLTLVGNDFYFSVEKIKGLEDQYKGFIEPFLGKWWKVPLPEEFSRQFGKYSGDESEMTVEEKAMKELFEKTKFFGEPKYVKSGKVDGEKSYKYEVTLDKEALTGFLEESAKLSGEAIGLGGAPLPNMEEILADIDFSGEMWVSKETMAMKRLSGVLKFVDKGEVEFEYTVGDLGETVTITAPADATVFDPMMLLGGGL